MKLPNPAESGAVHDAPEQLQRSEAVLLCAGMGRRMGVLTERLPKPLIPIHGKPLLDWHLENLARAGVRSVVLVVGHLESAIRSHVQDGSSYGLEVRWVRQERPLGTGDGLRCAAPAIRSSWILVGYADVYFGAGGNIWKRLLQGGTPSIVGAAVPNAGDYGRLFTRDRGGRLTLESIAEKDGRPTPGLVNAGAYLLPQGILATLDRLPPSSRGEIELTDALSSYVAAGHPIDVIVAEGWVDVGSPASIAQAEALA